MEFYKTAKTYVPLRWKIGAHQALKKFKYQVTLLRDHRVKRKLTNGPPIPPGDLIFLVANHRHPSLFLKGGKSASQAIVDLLARQGVRVEDVSPVLEFGCGVGRIIRYFESYEVELHGTDYNPDLIGWCRKNLEFANFNINGLSGGLPYQDNTFGLIYSWSVFTHLSEPLQSHWMRELTRILRPGGYLYITTHGDFEAPELLPDDLEQFNQGRLVVRLGEHAGENACAAYHPKEYMKQLAAPLVITDFIARGARGESEQDAWLLRKPEPS